MLLTVFVCSGFHSLLKHFLYAELLVFVLVIVFTQPCLLLEESFAFSMNKAVHLFQSLTNTCAFTCIIIENGSIIITSFNV